MKPLTSQLKIDFRSVFILSDAALDMKSEITNITINKQIWFPTFISLGIYLFSQMELQIFFSMKNESTNITINKQKLVCTFFDLGIQSFKQLIFF